MSSQDSIADDTLAIGKALSRLRAQEQADIAECRRLAMVEQNKRPEPPAKPQRTGNPVVDWQKRREYGTALTAYVASQLESGFTRVVKARQFGESGIAPPVEVRPGDYYDGKLVVKVEDCATPEAGPFVWIVTDGARVRWCI